LLNGWDDIDLTDSHRDRIATFRSEDRKHRPWALPAKR
jgi:3-isopropylmalate/(R)-2-methylmalate dehydratase small subunit